MQPAEALAASRGLGAFCYQAHLSELCFRDTRATGQSAPSSSCFSGLSLVLKWLSSKSLEHEKLASFRSQCSCVGVTAEVTH